MARHMVEKADECWLWPSRGWGGREVPGKGAGWVLLCITAPPTVLPLLGEEHRQEGEGEAGGILR